VRRSCGVLQAPELVALQMGMRQSPLSLVSDPRLALRDVVAPSTCVPRPGSTLEPRSQVLSSNPIWSTARALGAEVGAVWDADGLHMGVLPNRSDRPAVPVCTRPFVDAGNHRQDSILVLWIRNLRRLAPRQQQAELAPVAATTPPVCRRPPPRSGHSVRGKSRRDRPPFRERATQDEPSASADSVRPISSTISSLIGPMGCRAPRASGSGGGRGSPLSPSVSCGTATTLRFGVSC